MDGSTSGPFRTSREWTVPLSRGSRSGAFGRKSDHHAAGAYWLGATPVDAFAGYFGTFVDVSMSGFASAAQKPAGAAKPNLRVTPDTQPDPPGFDIIGI